MKIGITPEMRAKAKKLSEETGPLNGSFMNGERNEIGYLGELAFEVAYPRSVYVGNFDYDYLLDNWKVDVKARIANAEMKPEYAFTLPCLKKDQDCDFYFFTAVNLGKSFVELLGYMRFDEFKKKAVWIEKGSEMPQGGYYRSSGYNILVKDLNADIHPYKDHTPE